jgi:hypothetical protein
MRRLIPRAAICALTAALVLAPAACKRHRKNASEARPSTAAQNAAAPSSLLSMADPKASVQLLHGFYDPEQGSWRWTAKQFSVVLHPPANAKNKGALLVLKLNIPEVSIQELKTLTLSANVNGRTLAPETFTKPGDYTYQRDVPASLLAGDMTTVDFLLDKAIPPGRFDLRELGVVAQAVGFEAK